MANTKLSALAELAATPAVDDEVYIRDVSEAAADESKRITMANLLAGVVNLTHYLLYPYLSEEAGANSAIADADTYYAHSLYPDEALLITKIGVFVYSKTSNGCNIIVEVWTDSGGDPDAVIAGATATIAAGSVVADTINWFTLGTPASLSASTLYWIVIRSSDSDGANYYNLALWDGKPQYGKGIWGVGTESKWLSGTWQDKDPPITLIYGRKA